VKKVAQDEAVRSFVDLTAIVPRVSSLYSAKAEASRESRPQCVAHQDCTKRPFIHLYNVQRASPPSTPKKTPVAALPRHTSTPRDEIEQAASSSGNNSEP